MAEKEVFPKYQVDYITITDIDLTTAHTDQEYKMPGIFDTIVVENIVGTIQVKLNDKNRGSIELSKCRAINSVFDRFYYTNTAQPGGTITLQIGASASFGVSSVGVRPATFPTAPLQIGGVANQVTTNAYVALGAAMSLLTVVKSTFVLREIAGVNAVRYQVQASMDGINWVTLKTDVVILANGIAYETLSDLWPYVIFNIIDNVGGSHGTVEGKWYYESLL